ncbi:MAG: hypothetical protein EOO50_14670 [Flavobacterium sp.]|uniref:hypothetical protein n=1 Tax=Flavobacterium sp. TaxID=239 RepID=UPI00121EA867|nr:hypothetical protein [Flavobacterium sp.]RZJ65205.1 MAG: hypothetical protein EOO50_14670 [Flavobacterium sp.]
MKNIVLAFVFVIGFANAQTSAKRDPQFQVDFEMELEKPLSSIMISTFKSPAEQDKKLVFRTSTPACNGLKGLRLRLVNGEILTFSDAVIECGAFNPAIANMVARIPLTAKLEEILEGKEILEFTIGNVKTPVKFKEQNENFVLLQKLVRDERGF